MLAEPTTTLTDYLLAVEGAWLAHRLLVPSPHLSRRLWGAAFAATALGAGLGGTWHGFRPYLSAETAQALWLATYLAIGAAHLLALAGSGRALFAPGLRGVFVLAVLLKAGAYSVAIVASPELRFVAYDYGLSMLVLALLAWTGWRRPGAGALLAGVVVSLAGALVQHSRFTLHPHLNHNDLFHLVQMAGLWLYSTAAREFEDDVATRPRIDLPRRPALVS